MNMGKLNIILIIVLTSFFAFSGQNQKNVARVKIKKGVATVISPDGSKGDVTRGMWIKEGAIIETQEKSFVRLSFLDKSSMNIGPKSKL